MKKINFDGIAKRVEDVSNILGTIAKNRLIIAIFLIVDGITFILNPDNTLGEMARNIILIALFATFSVFITNVVSKTKDLKTIIISLIILVLGIIFYIFPDIIAAYIQLLLALFIIYDGTSNIVRALNLTWVSSFAQKIKEKFAKLFKRKKIDKKKQERNEKFKDVDKNLNAGLEEQANKLMVPLKGIVNKTKKSSVLFTIMNGISVILGIILLIFPGVSMSVWGLIFLYTGFSNLIVAAKSMGVMRKIKERRFKEILIEKGLDDEKKKTNSKSTTSEKKTNDGKKKNEKKIKKNTTKQKSSK